MLGLSLVVAPMGQGSRTVQAASNPSPTDIFTFVQINATDCDVRLSDKTVTTAIVPATAIINGNEFTVTAVASNGFANSPNLEKVRLPRTIKTIGAGGFLNCGNLTSLTLPAVETINTNAFGMTGLEYLIIPETTTTVAATILRNANTKVYVRGAANQPGWNSGWNNNNQNTVVDYNSDFQPEISYRYEEAPAPAFAPFGFMPLNYNILTPEGWVVDAHQPFVTSPVGSPEEVYIPAVWTCPDTLVTAPVIAIDDYAFLYNDVASVTIGYSAAPIRIGDWAFNGMYACESITINRDIVWETGWETLSEQVFAGTSIKTIVLPDTITELGDSMFQDSYALEDIHFITPSGLLSQSDEQALANTLVSTKQVMLPVGLTSIGAEAFSGLYSIEEIHIPNTVIEVGYSVFVGWDEPQAIYLDFADEPSLPIGWNSLWKGSAPNSIINYATPQIFDIVYDLHGGDHTGNPTEYTPKDSYIALNDATKTGYIFNGWWNTETELQVVGISTGSTGDLYLEARWTAITYTIQYNSNKPSGASGNISGATGTSTHTYGVTSSLTPNGFVLTGWIFAGWKNASGTSFVDGYNSVLNWSDAQDANIVLEAQWVAKTYSVTYHENRPGIATSAVTGTMASSNFTYDTASALRANEFVLAGWTFTGWADGFGNSFTPGQSVSTLSDGGSVALFAQWTQNTYTVAYNTNKPSIASGSVSGAMANSSHTYDSASNLTSNAYTLNGWTFIGWNTQANGSGASYTNAQQISTLIESGTITLYAQWVQNSYEIAYNANKPSASTGALTGSMTNSSHSFDTLSNLRTNDFHIPGWTFMGWNTVANGSGTSYTNGQVMTTVLLSGTVTLYAQWSENTYTIVYHGNGNTSGSTATTSLSYEESKNLTANGFSRTGYRFAGWATSASGPVVYANQASVNKLTTANGGVVNLYAKWDANYYTISYNGNGNTGGSTAASGHYYDTSKVLTSNGFTKTGYHFAGWTTSSNGAVVYSNGASVLNLTTVHNATITLYAKWNANTYTVAYNANGGSGTMANTSHQYDTSAALRANAFSMTGHKFIGWATSTDGAVIYSNSESVLNLTSGTGTVTLYAKWQLISYYLTVKGSCPDCSGNPMGIMKGGFTNALTTWGQVRSVTAPAECGLQKGSALFVCAYEFDYWGISTGGTYSTSRSISPSNLTETDGAYITLTAYYKAPPSSCVSEDTLVTLADGSTKRVDELNGTESLLVWNFTTGTYDAANIVFIESSAHKEFDVIHLFFADGTDIKVIGHHAYWSFDLNRYVTFKAATAEDYIGQMFKKQTANMQGYEAVELVDVQIYKEITSAWSPVTVGHLNFYTNGMLSMPGATTPFMNVFEVEASTMSYDVAQMQADIATYGLFTYAEVESLGPIEIYHALQVQYWKVAIGKGMMTMEDIQSLAERFQEFFV